MSEEAQNQEVINEQEVHNEPQQERVTIEDIFKNKNSNVIKTPEKEEAKNPEPKKQALEQKPEPKKQDDESEDEEPEESELDIARKEISKVENARKKARDELSKVYVKVKNYEKKINALVEDGVIDKELADSLISEVKHDAKFEEDEELSGFPKLLKIASTGLNKYRESIEEGFIDEDELLDKKIEAFDQFMNNASAEERENTLEELEKLKDKPVLLAKKMLSIGLDYYNDVLKDIDESGGIKNFKLKETREKERLQKKVDKLEKEILRYKEQYENFVEPKSMNLPSGGSSNSREVKGNSIAEILDMARKGSIRD